MITTTDISNRVLVMLGLQKIISSLSQDSAEAQALNVVFAPIQSWCFGIANWNFARNTTGLTSVKGPTPSNPTAWSSTYPSPPWLYEYPVPADFIRAIYITNSAPAQTAGYLGEPQRFAVSNDTISAVEQTVILTNQVNAVLIYTANIADPTAWPWYFERLVVIALAHGVCLSLTRSPQLFSELSEMLEQQINIATQMNMIEGLLIDDNTPEWIQALGINYPYRRYDGRAGISLPQSRREKATDQ